MVQMTSNGAATTFTTPADRGMAYEDVTLRTDDGVLWVELTPGRHDLLLDGPM